MDFIFGLRKTSSGDEGIWTIVDRFSKQAHFFSVRKQIAAEQMAKIFLVTVFKYHGMPRSIVSDNYVQLLPVELADVEAITGGNGRVEKMVWDYSGERLAISFSGGDDMHSGLVAVYDTRKTPILAVSLMGFIRGPEAGIKALALALYDSLEQGLLLSVVIFSFFCQNRHNLDSLVCFAIGGRPGWFVYYYDTLLVDN
ncbi:hypothetical protein L7F22_021826 [Adiantum nelumboides]|nr:hypothetical protein [Adiantum nelumboides]